MKDDYQLSLSQNEALHNEMHEIVFLTPVLLDLISDMKHI